MPDFLQLGSGAQFLKTEGGLVNLVLTESAGSDNWIFLHMEQLPECRKLELREKGSSLAIYQIY